MGNASRAPGGDTKTRYHVHVMNSYDDGANSMNVFQEKGGKIVRAGRIAAGGALKFDDATFSVVGGSGSSYGGYYIFARPATLVLQSHGLPGLGDPDMTPVQIQPNVQQKLWSLHHVPESGYYVYEV